MRRWGQSVTAVLLSLRVARSFTSFRTTRDVQMVSTIQVDECDEATDSTANVTGADKDAGDADESVVEMSEVEMQALPKTFRLSMPKESCLSTVERQQLTRMIFETHYAPEGAGKEDRAMWYQSALEVQWLEEWAFSDGEKDKDEARRAVKKAVLQRVDLHKPLAYIIGHQPFYGCNIKCSPPLLCPRPETEMWTHWYVSNYLNRSASTGGGQRSALRVLDMCCGTGCIGIAIATHVPHAEVVAVDIMDESVRAADENARLNGLDSRRYRVIKSDMFEAFLVKDSHNDSDVGRLNEEGVSGKRRLEEQHIGSFDVVVANPPYVLPEQYVNLPPGIKLWESKLALVGDAKREQQQYLYFQELCELGAAVLKPKTQRNTALVNAPNLIIEVGLQAERVASIMERSDLWEEVSVHLDYAQQPRWISANSTH
ncbi:methyltransferase [Trypanosoma grayi]|uniref:methyltransferase n=1 Tax=Trypanosoma grayi TaxID=71804 RepID=UPI0004F498A0|nr:methyltransferase [Trypanosoma grayi]KEG12410.1 methyltransferase [Trypanosoma grayi]